MATSKEKVHELSVKDVDKCIRKALQMQDHRNKYQMLIECVKMMKLLLGIEELTVIL